MTSDRTYKELETFVNPPPPASSYEVAECNQLNTPPLTLTHSAHYKYKKNTNFPRCLVCLFWAINMDIEEDPMPTFKCNRLLDNILHPTDIKQHQCVINLLNHLIVYSIYIHNVNMFSDVKYMFVYDIHT